jgi:hypothetical protein
MPLCVVSLLLSFQRRCVERACALVFFWFTIDFSFVRRNPLSPHALDVRVAEQSGPMATAARHIASGRVQQAADIYEGIIAAEAHSGVDLRRVRLNLGFARARLRDYVSARGCA